jgi:hypothetical protein
VNILMLGRWLPPPRQAVRGTREYQFALRLARAHQLTLAFVTDNPDVAGAISALRTEFGDLEFAAVPRAWKSLASAISLATGGSCTLSYFRSEALRTRLADRLHRTRYDLVFVSASSMIQYALEIDPTIPLLIDFNEVESEWWMRQAARGAFPATRIFRAEATRLRIAEAAAARRAACCVVATPEAAQIVQALAPGAPTTVIADGVDVGFFGNPPRPGNAPTVVFNTPLNGEVELRDAFGFCRSILPAVRARIPQARVVVSSKELPPAGHLAGVEVVSPCADSRPLFHSGAVAVAPLWEGSDVRSSVLEPMAAGVPVVTTSKVRDQLGARAGRDLRVSDDPLGFAMHVIQLLEDAPSRASLGARGRAFVADHHAWSVMTTRLIEVVEATVPSSRPAPCLQPGPTTAARP